MSILGRHAKLLQGRLVATVENAIQIDQYSLY